MERPNELSKILIHNGTVSHPRDMVRALETIEGLTYRQVVDGNVMAEGRATLVKIMAEPGAATILVNGCLFLNVLSFDYLTFETEDDGRCVFELVGNGIRLTLEPVEEDESETPANPRAARLIEAEGYDPDVYARLDDDDEDDLR